MTNKDTARFFAKIETRPDGCWVWTGPRARGYGRFYFDHHEEKAHRVSYRYFMGDLPAYSPRDGELDHLCRNRACVNPTHLELVDHRTNIQRGQSGHHIHSTETRMKMSETQKASPSRAMLGRSHSPATIERMAAARRAYWQRKREAA